MEINYLYWVQVLAISGLFALFHYTLLRRNGHHFLNRLVLLSSMVFILLLPHLRIPVVLSQCVEIPFSMEDRALVSNISPAESETGLTMNPEHHEENLFPGIFALIFLLVSAILFLRLLHSVLIILKKIRQADSQPYQNCFVIFDENIDQPYSFFKWIFLPYSLKHDEAILPVILAHESTHARLCHSLDNLFTSLLRILLWWNPFFHYLERQLRLTHEYQADAAAAKKTGIREYAAVLIHQIFPGSPSLITHSFFQSPIKSRIMMLSAPSKNSLRHWFFIPVFALALLFFSTSFIKAPLQPNATAPLMVVIDAGHGGLDHGAISDTWKEKDLVLALSNALQQKAMGTNISIILTRSDDELPVPANIQESLRRRVSIAEEAGADALISVHIGTAAEGKGTDKHGVRAFIAGKNEENALKSKPLATSLLNGLTGGPLYVQPEIQQRREQSIYVLDNNTKPAVLLEVGFITNSKDMEVLAGSEGIDNIAERILKGLQEYAARR